MPVEPQEDAGVSAETAAAADAADEQLLSNIFRSPAAGDQPGNPDGGDQLGNPDGGDPAPLEEQPGEAAAAGNPEGDDGIPDDLVTPAKPEIKPDAPPADQAPKPEEKPAERIPESIQTKDPKANHAFAQLRHEVSELNRKLSEQTAELERYRSGQAKAPEIEAKLAEIQTQHQKEKEELEARLGQYDLAATKAFQMKYDVPLRAMLGRASTMLQRAGVSKEDADQLASELVQKPTLDRANQLTEVVPALAGALVNLYEDFDEVRGNRDAALRDWKSSKAALGVDERQMQQAKALELAEGLVSQVLKQQEETGNPFFRRSAAKPDWNKKVDALSEQFKGILKTGDQVTLANLVAEGLTAREYRKMWESTRQRLAALEAEVKEKFGMQPAPRGRPAVEEPAARPARPLTDEELIDRSMRHLDGIRRLPGE